MKRGTMVVFRKKDRDRNIPNSPMLIMKTYRPKDEEHKVCKVLCSDGIMRHLYEHILVSA